MAPAARNRAVIRTVGDAAPSADLSLLGQVQASVGSGFRGIGA